MDIGKRITECRKALGMSQPELGRACEASKQTIYKYENGIITNIPLEKIEKIATALQVSPAYLMGWEEKEQPRESIERTCKPDEIEIKEIFHNLNQENRAKLLEIGRLYLKAQMGEESQ